MHASGLAASFLFFRFHLCAWADVSMASEIQHGVELYAGLHSPGPRYGLPSACFDKASKSPSTGRWAWALACISSRYYAPVHAYRPLYCTLHAYRSSRTVSLGRVRRPTWGPAPQHSSQKIARARVDEVRFIGRHFMREMQGHYSPGPQYRVPGTTGGAPGNYFASTHNLQAVAERHGTGRRSLSAVQLGAEPLFSLTAGSFSDPKRAAVPTTPGDTAAEYWRRATTLQTSEVPSFTRDVEKQPWSEAARGPNLYGDEVRVPSPSQMRCTPRDAVTMPCRRTQSTQPTDAYTVPTQSLPMLIMFLCARVCSCARVQVQARARGGAEARHRQSGPVPYRQLVDMAADPPVAVSAPATNRPTTRLTIALPLRYLTIALPPPECHPAIAGLHCVAIACVCADYIYTTCPHKWYT